MRKAIITETRCHWCGGLFDGTASQCYESRLGNNVYCKRECWKAALRVKRAENRRPLLERFLALVKRLDNGCLEWTGFVRKDGYVTMMIYGKLRQVTQVAWFLHYGWWPPPKTPLDHMCHVPGLCEGGVNDPHRRCAEWSHLKLSTPQDNASVARSNGGKVRAAMSAAVTHCPAGHEYTEENTVYHRNRKGYLCRRCRVCVRSGYGAGRRSAVAGPDPDLLAERNQQV